MKKSGILAAICFLAALCAIPAITLRINREKEEIEIREVPLSGDPEEAKGVVLEYAVHWDRKLLWDTVYAPGSGRKAESHFSFSSEEVIWPDPRGDSVEWMSAGGWGMGSGPGGLDLDEVYFSALVKGVASHATPGETHTEEVRLADYYDFYPFYLTVESERRNVFYGFDYQLEEGVDVLVRQIALPVSEEDRVVVTITMDEGGNCVEVNSKLITDDGNGADLGEDGQASAESGRFRTLDGAFGDQGIYLGYGFSGGEKGKGGCGILYIPYTDRPEARGRYSMAADSRKTLDVERARKVWESESGGIELIDMEWNQDAGLLYLVGAADGRENLYVLQEEGEELVLRQQIFVAEQSAELGRRIWGGLKAAEEGLLLTWERGSMGRGGFVFLTREEDLYSVFCRGNFPGIAPESSKEYASLFPLEYSWDFDGERLALAAYDTWRSTDVWLGIFRREGMTYCGMYEHSGAREQGNNGISEIYPQGMFAGRARANEPLKLRLEGKESR